MTIHDDTSLVQRRRTGNRAAFETVVTGHYESIWRQHYLLTGNNQDQADDLTQETFVEVWSSLPTFRGQSLLRNWLYTIGVQA